MSRNFDGATTPPPSPPPTSRPRAALTARASTLADRLDLYRAERDTLDRLRSQSKEQEDAGPAVEEVMKQVVRDFQRLLVAARVNLAEVFTAFDKDGDGTVTIREFRTGLRALKITVADEMVEKLIEVMDRDGDGEIDYREFTKQFTEQPGQFRQPKPGELTDNPRYLSKDELEDAIRGFQQASHARNQGMVHLLSRWSLNVDVLHGLTNEQREALVDNVEVVHVKAGQEVVVAGSVGTATTFWIVLSGSCCIWLPPLDSQAFAVASSESPVDTTSDPAVRAKESAEKWIKIMHDTHAQNVKLASLQRHEEQRQAADYAARCGGKWAASAAGSVENRQRRESRSGHARRGHGDGPKLFGSLTKQQSNRLYVPGKGFKTVGKHTAREHRKALHEKVSGLVKNSLEASRQEKSIYGGGKRAMDELTLSSKATTLLGDRELAGNHVEMTFPPFTCFGEKRAFYNADDAKVLETGAQSVQMTVRATKDGDVKLLAVYRIDDIHAIMRAYQASMQDKIRFLRKMPQYKDKSDAELDKLAGFMRRTWAFEGDTIVSEGDEADSVYFVVSGQLSVTKAQPNGSRKVVNVLGAGASLGQMGVVQDNGKRAATCSALTDCELLIIHKYNFIRLSDPSDIKGIATKQAEIARLLEGGEAPLATVAAETTFLTGRSSGVPSGNSSTPDEGLKAFRPVKLSEIKKGTSVDVTRNLNPMLPIAPSVTRLARFEPLTPTEAGGQLRQTSPVADSYDTPTCGVDEDVGGAIAEGQETRKQSHARTHSETTSDRKVSRGHEQARHRQRPQTTDELVYGRTASTCNDRASATRQSSPSVWPNGPGKEQRFGLTATTGQHFDRREARPWSPPCASLNMSARANSGDRRPSTAPTCRGMAASPEGTYLLHRLRGLATTRHATVRQSQISQTLQRSMRLHASPSPRGAGRGGDASVCRAHPGSAEVQLPWGVSPESPRGRLIVYRSRLPASNA